LYDYGFNGRKTYKVTPANGNLTLISNLALGSNITSILATNNIPLFINSISINTLIEDQHLNQVGIVPFTIAGSARELDVNADESKLVVTNANELFLYDIVNTTKKWTIIVNTNFISYAFIYNEKVYYIISKFNSAQENSIIIKSKNID
jgi:hypothetical protein